MKSVSESGIYESLHAEFSRRITRKFSRAVEEYRLFGGGDRVLLPLSGDKSSMLLAALLRDYERHGSVPISVQYLVFGTGENDVSELFSELSGIPEASVISREYCPDFGTAAMELGCNKIASAEHFDDVIEGIVSSMIFDGEAKALLPRQRGERNEITVIRPLYLVREGDITAWADANRLRTRVIETVPSPERELVKRLIARLCEGNGQVAQNIFRSVCNVRLDHIISYSDGISEHSFLDDYDE